MSSQTIVRRARRPHFPQSAASDSLLRGLAFFAATGVAAFCVSVAPATAHHSFAMFDSDNPIDLEGTLREFKYTNPHTFIVLEVKDATGAVTTWSLEGASPSALVRAGLTSRTIKPGDELKIKVKPLRSGAPGGAWDIETTSYKDGAPLPIKH
jgi:hypothetical protein